jgi:hypothetical protein
MLRGSRYRNLTLLEASIRYVKEDPGHGPKIAKMSNLDSNRKISSLSDEEFERYWKAIEKNERWEVGEEDSIPKWIISGVHKKKGVITEYLICINKESKWLPKQEAIKWTMEGKLHATLVHIKKWKSLSTPRTRPA